MESRLTTHMAEWHSTTRTLTNQEMRNLEYCDPHDDELEMLASDAELYADLAPRGDLVLRFFVTLKPEDDDSEDDSIDEIHIGPRLVRVSSQVLPIASPVFDRMLNISGCKEERSLRKARMTGCMAVLDLADDDPDVFEVILRVLHHRDNTKREMAFADIVGIAELADKYELADPLRLKLDVWIQPFLDKATTVGFEDFLTIAWVFRMTEKFKTVSEEIIWTACEGEDGVYFKTTDEITSKLSEALPESVISESIPQAHNVLLF